MPQTLTGKLVVAISSRALFDFEEENRLFETGDEAHYMHYQLAHVQQQPGPGVALALVKKLLAFNTEEEQRVEVVMLSRNDPASGLRVFASAQAAGMRIERGVFTRGRDPFAYLRPLGAHLFLSANAEDVQQALSLGFPAARVLTESRPAGDHYPQEVRIAFDGDAVLFDDEAERVFKDHGLQGFRDHEVEHAARPMKKGPMMVVLEVIHAVQQLFPNKADCPFRTALVTARGLQAMERPINTLGAWGVRVDETISCGGDEKGPFLQAFGADLFFDDSPVNVESARQHVATGHVPHGVSNKRISGKA